MAEKPTLVRPRADGDIVEKRPKNPPPNAYPKDGFAVIVDGCIKSQHDEREGAETAARAIKKAFPVVHVAVLDAKAGARSTIDA